VHFCCKSALFGCNDRRADSCHFGDGALLLPPIEFLLPSLTGYCCGVVLCNENSCCIDVFARLLKENSQKQSTNYQNGSQQKHQQQCAKQRLESQQQRWHSSCQTTEAEEVLCWCYSSRHQGSLPSVQEVQERFFRHRSASCEDQVIARCACALKALKLYYLTITHYYT